MAGLANTLTQGLRAMYPNNLDKNEDRLSQYGGYALFVDDTKSPESIISADVIDKAKKSFGNTMSIPVIDGADVTIGSARTCTIADTENVSKQYNLTFVTYQFGFTMVPSSYQNNDIKYQQDYDKKLLKYLKKFAATLDSTAIALLDTDRTQVTTSPFIGVGAKYGDFIGDLVSVTQAQKGLIFNDVTAILSQDDFYGKYNVLGSSTGKSTVGQYSNQGANNGVNTMFQFGDYDFSYSNRVPVTATKESTFYVMPKGTVATMNRNEPDAVAGSVINSDNYFETVMVPIVDLEMGVHYFKECANNSGINGGVGGTGLTASVKETFIWSTDVCFVTAYNRDIATLPSAILKIEISNT